MSDDKFRYLKNVFKLAAVFLLGIWPAVNSTAQTDIRITGAQQGFPIALPQFCDTGAGNLISRVVPGTMARDLDFSGLFVVVNPESYVEEAGKCDDTASISYSDWSVIGVEFVVKGVVTRLDAEGKKLELELRLFDIQRRQAVLGKKYRFSNEDGKRVAHRFANEIVGYFTGSKGIFGTKIAYVSRVGRFKELFVVNFDGSDPIQLTTDRGLVVSPAWSPSGDRLIFTSYRTRRPELYFVSPEGSRPRRITRRAGSELGAEYLPDGSGIIAAASDAGISNLVIFDLKGKARQRLTKRGSINISPSLSPDGSQIAFCSNRSGGPQIYIMSRSGEKVQTARRISYTESRYCTSPAWSPKGDKIAFVCRSKGNQIFMVDSDGSNPRQLTFSGFNENPSWSPDGRFLVFSSDFGLGRARNLAVMALASGQTKQITFSKEEEGQPSWSPNIQ